MLPPTSAETARGFSRWELPSDLGQVLSPGSSVVESPLTERGHPSSLFSPRSSLLVRCVRSGVGGGLLRSRGRFPVYGPKKEGDSLSIEGNFELSSPVFKSF